MILLFLIFILYTLILNINGELYLDGDQTSFAIDDDFIYFSGRGDDLFQPTSFFKLPKYSDSEIHLNDSEILFHLNDTNQEDYFVVLMVDGSYPTKDGQFIFIRYHKCHYPSTYIPFPPCTYSLQYTIFNQTSKQHLVLENSHLAKYKSFVDIKENRVYFIYPYDDFISSVSIYNSSDKIIHYKDFKYQGKFWIKDSNIIFLDYSGSLYILDKNCINCLLSSTPQFKFPKLTYCGHSNDDYFFISTIDGLYQMPINGDISKIYKISKKANIKEIIAENDYVFFCSSKKFKSKEYIFEIERYDIKNKNTSLIISNPYKSYFDNQRYYENFRGSMVNQYKRI